MFLGCSANRASRHRLSGSLQPPRGWHALCLRALTAKKGRHATPGIWMSCDHPADGSWQWLCLATSWRFFCRRLGTDCQ
jgi:hypothetical protein